MLKAKQSLVLLFLMPLVTGCGSPAQLGDDEKCHKAAEALYTAVCSKKLDLVEKCEKNINQLKDKGDMPASAHAGLTAIIAKARAERWQAAAEDLHWFISGQKASTGKAPHKH